MNTFGPELVFSMFKDYGIGGLIFAVVIYVFLRGEFHFHFPRRGRKKSIGGGKQV
jgi:hypothetical protein